MPKKGKTLFEKPLSGDAIRSIEQVLTVNRDIVDLFEKRGVKVLDVRQVCWLALNFILSQEKDEFVDATRYYAENKDKSAWMDVVTITTREGGFQMGYEEFRLTFGVELAKGERHDFRVPQWTKEMAPEGKEVPS